MRGFFMMQCFLISSHTLSPAHATVPPVVALVTLQLL